MTLKEKFFSIHDNLFGVFGECTCPLIHNSAFQLLIAVMLSAQCRDDRVNQVTEKLFAIAPDADSMAELEIKVIEDIIKPCGLYAVKSRNISSASKDIVKKHGSKVPDTMEELTELAGIGRKSANVVLGNAFGIPGFPVDTHVIRVLNRIGVVSERDPEKIEKTVCRIIPDKLWTNFSHLIIQHGRKCCKAANPACSECVLKEICAKKGVKK